MTRHRTARTALTLFTLAGLAAATLTPLAQAQTGAPAKQTAEEAPARTPDGRISIDFPGGRLREYIATLREATRPETVNVVAPESLLNMKVGEISLRDADVQSAVRCLEWAVEPRGALLVNHIGRNSFGVSDGRVQADPNAAKPAQLSQIQVLSLRDLTEPLPGDPPNARFTVEPDVVITAVRTALQADGDAESAEMKFHADSGLLIVRGSIPQIQAASSVIDRMQNDMRSRRKAMKDAMAGQVNLDEVRAEAEKHAIRTRLLEQNVVRASEEVAKLEAMRKEGHVAPEDVSSGRAVLDRAKAELEASRIDMAMAQARVASVEKRFGEAAAHEGRSDEGLGEIPQGRSTVEYTSASITGKDLKALATSLESAAAQLLRGESNVAIRAEGDTLVVTGGQPAQRLVRRMLLDPANPAKGPIVQKSRPRPTTDEKPAR
ncbi:MAG TPA: hypothetical protein VD997_09650 [Phycisphaerales bacterium]|nr:hypothetical protein [Phycisphaerales bacterium]